MAEDVSAEILAAAERLLAEARAAAPPSADGPAYALTVLAFALGYAVAEGSGDADHAARGVEISIDVVIDAVGHRLAARGLRTAEVAGHG